MVGFRTRPSSLRHHLRHPNQAQTGGTAAPRIKVTSPDGHFSNTSGLSRTSSTRGDHHLRPPASTRYSFRATRPSTPGGGAGVGGQASQSSRRSSTGGTTAGGGATTSASAARKRRLVGGIGLRTRTPSMHARRGSRPMSTMAHLPFVVRWIIGRLQFFFGGMHSSP